MEIKLPEGYIAVKSEEYRALQRLSELLLKHRKTYFIFNRQYNSLFKEAETILKEVGK